MPANTFVHQLTKSRYTASMALITPFSFLIISPTTFAFAICFSSDVALRNASARLSDVSFRTAEPTLSDSIRSAQKDWSPKKGLMTVG
jgi:hypothetical protein